MKILYIENSDKIIKLLTKECEKSHYEIFILNEFKDALVFIKETKTIDLLILGLELTEIEILNHLKELRSLCDNLTIVLTAKNEPKLSFSEFKFLNIREFLKKPFKIEKFKSLILEIENEKKCTKDKSKEISLLENKNEDLQMLNEEVNLSLELFKEFSFYSETDLDGNITEISDSFCDLLGYKRTELIDKKHSIIKHPLENPLIYENIWQNITKGNTWVGEIRCKDKYGNDIWYKSIIFPKKDLNGVIIGYGANRQDITDKKIAELQSITDDLTNLHNKRFFKEIFISERNRAKRDKRNLVLLMLDIDNFKKYNDRYGHYEGDKALKKVASILKKNANRANDFAFRLGGEEFAIITSNLSSEKIPQYAEKIRESIFNQRILHIDNVDIGFLSISIGVFSFEVKSNFSCEEIYKFADSAMYEAKKLGRNKVVFYNKSI
jgi:two-component system, cell cycle response regulator